MDFYRDRRLLFGDIHNHCGISYGHGTLEDALRNAASPLVEIYSMHGLAESEEGERRRPYLHTMGPLDGGNTMQSGLAAGHHFGVTASTDQHSAHPGSYGYGRTAVWAEDFSREGTWRRCWTGERMR